MNDSTLSKGQKAYLDTVLDRLRENEFDLTKFKASSQSLSTILPPTYLWMGKRLKYSLLSLIGYIEEAVLIGSVTRVDLDTMSRFAQQALTDAQALRSSFKFIFPVVSLRVFPVLLTDEGAADLTKHFAANGTPMYLDDKSILFPVVFDSATNKIDYFRKVGIFGSAEVQACHTTAESLLAP